MSMSNEPKTVCFAAFEKAMLEAERKNWRLFATIVFLLVLLAVSNAAWAIYILS